MQGADFLLATASVCVALAGFTGIVAVAGRRGSGDWSHADILRFWQMIEVSMLGLLFALLPFLFYHLSVPGPYLWAASSAMLALASGIQMLRAAARTLRAFRSDPSTSLIFTGTYVLIGTVVILALIANAAGMVYPQAVGPYLVGIYWQVCLAAVLFWRLMKFSGLPYRPPASGS